MNTFYSFPTIAQKLFGDDAELFSSVNELFEMEIANLEYAILPQEQLLNRSAFFKMINGQPTKHFLLYAHQAQVVSENRSAKTRSYFEDGQFSTGYATHSLFPYRGKFHPQLIKGLLNILGIQEGETILDPMCGSGTTNIEAALMGIHSFAVDISPFCQFMTQTKFEALTLQKNLIEHLQGKTESLFHFFHVDNIAEQLKKIDDPEKLKVYHLALLAFLDAMGYSKRVTTSTHQQLFEKVLARYIGTVKNFLENPHFSQHDIGNVVILSNSNSGQGDKSKTEISVGALIKTHYPHAKFVGFVDGIGWYVRKGDLKRMVSAYDEVFTFHQDELQRFERVVLKELAYDRRVH